MNDANLGDEVFMGVSVNGGRHRPAKNLSKTQKNLTDESSSQHTGFQHIIQKPKYKKPTFEGRFFVVTCSKSYILRSRRGIVPAKCNYFPTDYELILSLFRCFSYKDLLILRADTKTVKQLMGDFVKVETNIHLCPLVSQRKSVPLKKLSG